MLNDKATVLQSLRQRMLEFEDESNSSMSINSNSDIMPSSDESELSEKAYQKILRSLSVREQSSVKMKEKLLAAGFPNEDCERAIERALRNGIISDRRYADALIRSTLSAGKGLEHAKREIEHLGIDIDSLDSYQDYLEQGEDGELERALSYLRMHPSRATNIRDASFKKLIRRGFSSSISSHAARIYSETNS